MLVKVGDNYINIEYISCIVHDERAGRYTIYLLDDCAVDVSEIEMQHLVKRMLAGGYLL